MSRAQAIELVRNGNRFLVTCHRRPDADALGSAIGFAEVLRKLGKEASVFSPDEPAASIAFLPGIYDVLRTIPAGTAPFDATFVTDTASGSLLPKGLPAHDVTGPIVALDHHVSFDDFADVVVRDDSMAATGELVLDMAVELGVRPSDLSLEGATCLYAALVADTGGFRYACTRSRTLRFAAERLDMGVDPWRVASNLFEHWAP
ncbi:MAG: DHH family phosphoesterase, partial [Myxococcales bacterium]|nr:DHH family phosphoesterase [Myxococcales bacterium]